MIVLTVALLIVGGIVLLAIELFVVPGFSVPGIGGIGLIGYGVYLSWKAYGVTGAAVALVISAAASVLLIRAALKSRALKRVWLDHDSKTYHAVDDYSVLADAQGMTVTDCRPAGAARFGDDRYDVVTDGEYLTTGTPVVVTGIEGTRIVVARSAPDDRREHEESEPVRNDR